MILDLVKGMVKQLNQNDENEIQEYAPEPQPRGTKLTHLPGGRSFSGGVDFTLYAANGGYIVSTRNRVDEYKGEEIKQHLYVIPDGLELGEEISKIITFEGLRIER